MYVSTISSMLILQCLKKFFLQKCFIFQQVQWAQLSMRGCKQKRTSGMPCNLGNSLKTFGIGNSKQLTRNSSAKLRNCSVRCRKQQRIPKIQKCLNKPAKKEKIQNAETIQLRPTDPPSRSTQIFTSIFCHQSLLLFKIINQYIECKCNISDSHKRQKIQNAEKRPPSRSAQIYTSISCCIFKQVKWAQLWMRCRKQRASKIQKCLSEPAKKEKILNAEKRPPSRSAQIYTSICCCSFQQVKWAELSMWCGKQKRTSKIQNVGTKRLRRRRSNR